MIFNNGSFVWTKLILGSFIRDISFVLQFIVILFPTSIILIIFRILSEVADSIFKLFIFLGKTFELLSEVFHIIFFNVPSLERSIIKAFISLNLFFHWIFFFVTYFRFTYFCWVMMTWNIWYFALMPVTIFSFKFLTEGIVNWFRICLPIFLYWFNWNICRGIPVGFMNNYFIFFTFLMVVAKLSW